MIQALDVKVLHLRHYYTMENIHIFCYLSEGRSNIFAILWVMDSPVKAFLLFYAFALSPNFFDKCLGAYFLRAGVK